MNVSTANSLIFVWPSNLCGYGVDDGMSTDTYDQDSNITATGGKNFTYDSQNELAGTASGASATIVYDGDGNRVAKSVTANGVTTTTYYLVDDLNPTGYSQVVEELAANEAVEREYTYGLQRISENQPINGTWTVSFYGYDGSGNVRNLTNSAGTVTDRYEYDAFGNSFTVAGSTPNNYLYRGEQFDSDLGLYYLRARYYDPNTGRFMSRDPEDGKAKVPASLHKYLYANGDPVNRIDPRGRDVIGYGLLVTEDSTAGLLEMRATGFAIKVGFCVEALLLEWVEMEFIDPMISAVSLEVYETEAREICAELMI